MGKFPPPEQFDFKRPQEWPQWRKRFERYAALDELSKKEGEVQVSALVYALGPDAETVFDSLTFASEDDKKKLKEVLKKLDEYFAPKRNVIHERAVFYQRYQKSGESVEEFVRCLYELASTCDFTDRDTQIRDRLVVGIADRSVSEELQMKDTLTLAQASQIARQAEMVKRQITQQGPQASREGTQTVAEIHRSARGSRARQRGYTKGNSTCGESTDNARGGPSHVVQHCEKCGKSHGRNQCPAYRAKCHKCNRVGHYATVCRFRGRGQDRHGRSRRHSAREVVVKGYSDDSSEDSFFLGAVCCDDVTEPWEVKLKLCGTREKFKLDTGADVTVLTAASYDQLPRAPPLEPVGNRLSSVGGSLSCRGKFRGKIKKGGKLYVMDIYVVESAKYNLLSRAASKAMGFIKIDIHETELYGDVGLMKCAPVKIKLKADAQPYSLNAARRISLPLLPKVKAELQRMADRGVISPIKEPTEWCAPIVPVLKRDGNVRICVDLKRLNQSVVRERFIIPTIDEILPKLSGAGFFSSLDAASGFWAIPLDPASQKLTTFITPFGRYCFNRLPFGISSAPELFHRQVCELLGDLDGVCIYMDDILVYGSTKEQHDARLEKVLKVIKDSGLKLNKSKCVFGQESLDFLGHRIDSNGVTASKAKIRAVTELSAPTCVTELRRSLGLFNYLGRYVPRMATLLKPLSDLLRSDVSWIWGPNQQSAFDEAKRLLTQSPTLAYFDPTKPTIVSADSSSYGLGGTLLQWNGDKLQAVAFASRTLTDAEKRYAQIEKECLASVWACEKFAQYLVGLENFELQTDHKPLVPLINKKDIDQVPLRCQRLLMRLMRFNPTAVHVPGKYLTISDTLSRSPLKCSSNDILRAQEIDLHVDSIESKVSSDRLEAVRSAIAGDEILPDVIEFTLSGWPDNAKDVPPALQKFFNIRSHLSVSNGLLLYDDRLYIPESLQKEILVKIHDGHQGVQRCRARAQTSVYWIGITEAIKEMVASCEHCQRYRKRQSSEPLLPTPLPERPWEKVAMDLYDYGGNVYLIVVDYYSRFIEIAKLHSTSTKATVSRIKDMFARWGIPVTVVSDNGPQFASGEFAQFAQAYGFKHVTTSPHYPQANGTVERAVQTAKAIVRQDDPHMGLMVYRSTACPSTGYSPAELIMGRRIRTTLPTLDRHLEPKWPDHAIVQANDDRAKSTYKHYYDKRNSVKPLPPVQAGDRVLIRTDQDRTWRNKGTIVTTHPSTPRSVFVQTDQGACYRRNRRHIQLLPNSSSALPSSPVQSETAAESCNDNSTGSTVPASSTCANAPVMTKSGRLVKPITRMDL